MQELRLATIHDVSAVAQFQTEVWNETYRDIVPEDYLRNTTAEVRAKRWDSRIRSGERTVYLAHWADRLDGVVSSGASREPDLGGIIELMSLYVRADVRGHGLGSRLLDAAIGSAPAVLTVFEENESAIRFYRRHGFELDGHSEPDYDAGATVVRMVRA